MNNEIIVDKGMTVGLWLRLAINTVAIYLTAALGPGVEISSLLGAVIAAVVLAVVNSFVRPVLIVLTLPITLVTLGIFLLVINGASLMLAAWIAGDAFNINGLGAAILAWLVFWVLNWLITSFFQRRRVTIVRS